MLNFVLFDGVRWEEVLSWVALFLPFTAILFFSGDAIIVVLIGLITNLPIQRFLMWRLAKAEDHENEIRRL